MNKAQQKRSHHCTSAMLTHLNVRVKAKRRSTPMLELYVELPIISTAAPDLLTREHLDDYFSFLVKSHSWITIKVDRSGLQFFYKYILNRDWEWVDIIKPPVIKSLPDVLTQNEISHIINL